MLKLRRHLESAFAKKLTKHWPWRQNQGSAFSKFIKNIEHKYLKLTVFWDFDFGSVLGPF